jgi:hypothetical protein
MTNAVFDENESLMVRRSLDDDWLYGLGRGNRWGKN